MIRPIGVESSIPSAQSAPSPTILPENPSKFSSQQPVSASVSESQPQYTPKVRKVDTFGGLDARFFDPTINIIRPPDASLVGKF